MQKLRAASVHLERLETEKLQNVSDAKEAKSYKHTENNERSHTMAGSKASPRKDGNQLELESKQREIGTQTNTFVDPQRETFESNKNELLELKQHLKACKTALEATTKELRSKDFEIAKIRKGGDSFIPRPLKSREQDSSRMYELCQHLYATFQDSSVVTREDLVRKIQNLFNTSKITKKMPTLNEYLSQKDIAIVLCKSKQLEIVGLLSGNILVTTPWATRFATVKIKLKQVASEWHSNKSITHLLRYLQPTKMVVLVNGDLKMYFHSDYVYIYENGIVHYRENEQGVYLYPDCELKIINGTTYCDYW